MSDARRAYEAFIQLKRHRMQPTVATHTALLTAVGRVPTPHRDYRADRDESLALLWERTWHALVTFMDHHTQGKVPQFSQVEHTTLCNAGMHAAVRRGDMDKVAQLKKYMRHYAVQSDRITYTAVAKAAKQQMIQAEKVAITVREPYSQNFMVPLLNTFVGGAL
jgi:hypothetical protein